MRFDQLIMKEKLNYIFHFNLSEINKSKKTIRKTIKIHKKIKNE